VEIFDAQPVQKKCTEQRMEKEIKPSNTKIRTAAKNNENSKAQDMKRFLQFCLAILLSSAITNQSLTQKEAILVQGYLATLHLGS